MLLTRTFERRFTIAYRTALLGGVAGYSTAWEARKWHVAYALKAAFALLDHTYALCMGMVLHVEGVSTLAR